MLKMMTLRSRMTKNLTISDISALDMGEGIAQIARNDTKLKPQNRTDWQQLPPKAQPKRLIFALQMHFPDED